MLFRPTRAKTPKSPKLEPLKVYHEIGWAAMADSWPRPGMYVACKTGDLAASHSQHDMNSIQLQVDGEMLLVDLGHPPPTPRYFSEAREEFYEVQARAHNTIVVAGRDHLIDVQGSIAAAESTDRYRYAALDSAGACGQDVKFIRHVIMIIDPETQAGETLLVLDELDNPAPEKVDLFWHTLGRIELNEQTLGGVISGRAAAVQFALAGTTKAKVKTEIHTLDSRARDNVIQLSCGAPGSTHFASVFTRRRTDAMLQIAKANGAVSVSFGKLEAAFEAGRKHLKLQSITS
jgi:hypothetical protein